MKTSMAPLSGAGSQHVSMNTGCPLARYGSNNVSDAPQDIASTAPASNVPSLRKGATRASPSSGGPLQVGTIMTTGLPSPPPAQPTWTVSSSGLEAAMSAQCRKTAPASENG